MKIRKKIIMLCAIIITIIITFIVINQYQDSKNYKDAAKHYYIEYFKVIEQIESNNSEKSFELLKDKDIQASIDMLKTLLLNVKYHILNNKYIFYNDMENRYEDLEFLLNYKDENWSELSTDERGKIGNILLGLFYDLDRWKSKDSSTVWY